MRKLTRWGLIFLSCLSLVVLIGSCSSQGETTDSVSGGAVRGEIGVSPTYQIDGARPDSLPERSAPKDLALDGASEQAPQNGTVERKVIREQKLEMDVQNLDQILNRLERRIQEMEGAFIESIEQWQEVMAPNQIRYRAQAVFRVPVKQADDFVSQLEKEGNVLHRTTFGQDVTEEYVDNEARLRNLYRHEKRLLELYEEAKNVEEMLKLEAELSRIREQVEIIEGRQRYIDRVTSTVRITVDLTEVDEKEYLGHKPNESLWAEAWAGLKESIASIGYGAKRGLVFLISALPYLLLSAVIVIPLVWLLRRRKNNNNQSL